MPGVDRGDARRWVERYVEAWASNDADDIRALFTEDATYLTAPYREPWRGWDAIVEGWLDRKDEPGTCSFRSEVLGTDEDLAFVRGWTVYDDEEYPTSNLWVIRLAGDGRASEFVEWWMEERT